MSRRSSSGTPGGGLIEQQNPRPRGERKRDLEQALLAIGQLARRLVEVRLEAEALSRSSISATIAGRPPATRQKSAPEPSRSEIARPSDSGGRQIGKELIDLERARKAHPDPRAGGKSGDVAALEKDLRPRSAAITPVRKSISVVLPAPLGPISACRAPG